MIEPDCGGRLPHSVSDLSWQGDIQMRNNSQTASCDSVTQWNVTLVTDVCLKLAKNV